MLRLFCLVTAVILVLSLGIHVFDFNHVHYHAVFGEGFEAVMHANEQKWLLLMLIALIYVGTFFINSQQDLPSSAPSNRFMFDVVSVFEPNRRALRQGILHPKICE